MAFVPWDDGRLSRSSECESDDGELPPAVWEARKYVMERLELASLAVFKQDGTDLRMDSELTKRLPLFTGKAPAGHPYLQAFTEGASDEAFCFDVFEGKDVILLRRKLPSGRVISVDTCGFDMLNGGQGLAHFNMNSGDNIPANLKWVRESEARKLLMDFTVY